jgi:hypothetical protein
MPHDTMAHQEWSVPFGQTRAVSRRDAIRSGLATLGLAAASQTATASAPRPSAAAIDARCASPKKYSMKKSINLWAFPYEFKPEPEAGEGAGGSEVVVGRGKEEAFESAWA